MLIIARKMHIMSVALVIVFWTLVGSAFGKQADQILIKKSESRLFLLRNDKVMKTYKVAIGWNSKGPKQCLNDKKTPEGIYKITVKKKAGETGYYKALEFSYPNEEDRARASRIGCPAGGNVEIHGFPVSWSKTAFRQKLFRVWHKLINWTNGCIALTNPEMDEIWNIVEVGIPVEIKP
jgi:murein L,D-transpeptidase YafK